MLDDQPLQQADVQSDRIVFIGEGAKKAADSYRLLDIIVGKSDAQSFLRQVVGIEETSNQVALKTEDAKITDAVYKGSYSTADANETRTEEGQIQQGLGGGFRQLEPPKISIDPIHFGGHAKFDVSGQPKFDVSPKMHLAIDIEPGEFFVKPDNWIYQGVRRCSTDSECHRDEMCHEGVCSYKPPEADDPLKDDIDPRYDPRPWDDNQHLCGQMIRHLKRYRDDRSCRHKWNTYWNTEGNSDRSDYVCSLKFEGHEFVKVRPPYLAQIEWAKKKCKGSVKKFEFDMKLGIEAAIEKLKASADVKALAGGHKSKSTEPLFKEVDLGHYWAAIGWLPLEVRLEAQFAVSVTAFAQGKASFELANPVGLKEPFEIAGGFHYYGDEKHARQGRFYEEGEKLRR